MRLPQFLQAAACCGALLAQAEPVAPALVPSPGPTPASGIVPGGNPFTFRVPLHASADDDGTPRIWAAHDRYKASFGDGFAFYPVLGSAYEKNLPLAWRTRSIQ